MAHDNTKHSLTRDELIEKMLFRLYDNKDEAMSNCMSDIIMSDIISIVEANSLEAELAEALREMLVPLNHDYIEDRLRPRELGGRELASELLARYDAKKGS